jgi:histidyl-tRNA synthetase
MGDVVLLELLKSRALLPELGASLDYFYLIEDDSLRDLSLARVQYWRDQGRSVDYPLTPARPDKQFKRAQELNARFLLKLERAPGGQLAEKRRDMATRQEEITVL